MKTLIQALLLCMMITQLHAQSQQQDYTALRALYLNTGGDNWTNKTNWPDSIFFEMNPAMPAGTDVGIWYGVTTDASGFVHCIDMDGELDCNWDNNGGNNLIGSIPPEIDQLMNLEYLMLMDNDLSGSIPPEIGNLSNLKRLNLVRNELNGAIPFEILNLSNLTHLNLGANELTGSIFPQFSTLSDLIQLNLSYNNLSGSIPPELSQLSNLEYLWLGGNPLSGSIPPELGQLSSLIELILFTSQLTGSIPPELGQLSSLRKLFLETNQLTGSLPPELGNLSLSYLNVYDNQLSGCYDPNLLNLCNQLDSLYSTNAYISDGNNFDAPWEEFCNITIGICNSFEYPQTDATAVIQALEVDDVANETSFEVHLNSDTPISGYAVSVMINVGTPIDTNDIQLNIDDSTLAPDTYHIGVDDEDNIYITIARTDKIDQILNGATFRVVIEDDIFPVVIEDDIFPLMINSGHIISSIAELTSIGGSTLHGSLDASISLGLNHAYCDEKGTAKIYVTDATDYTYEWSTGETTPSIGDLDIGSYTVTVSDGMGTTTIIPFDINWAFIPVQIKVKSHQLYIDFEEAPFSEKAPLSEEVQISLDGGLTYIPINTHYTLPEGTYPIWIQRMSDECPTYIGDFTISNSIDPVPECFMHSSFLYYELEEHGTVDISLYNIQGQGLRTIYHAASDAGAYQIEIDKSNLPKGIYFIHVMFISNDGTTVYKTLKILI